MITVLVVLFVFLLVSGAPIFVAIGLASFGAILGTDSGIPSSVAVTRLFAGLDRFAVMALPFFIFAAHIMEVGGLSERIMNWARAMVRGVYGGLALATQLACLVFGALSGSSPATVVAIGRLVVPPMVKDGYDRGFISGLIASSASVALIMPPSITMMLFAAATGASVGALFVGGILPALVYSLLMSAYCFWYAKKRNIRGETQTGERPIGILQASREVGWALGVPVIILGGIYAGAVTPTEAAGLSAVYALLVSVVIYRAIDLRQFMTICQRSVVVTAQVMILIAVASIFGWLLTVAQLPQELATFSAGLPSTFYFLLMINVVLLLAGMFMDPNSLIIILGPIFYTVGLEMGLSPTHLGVVMTVNLAIGMFTPPFGLNLFVAPSVTGTSIEVIYRSIWPFFLISVIALALITYVPEITLFLARLVFPGSV